MGCGDGGGPTDSGGEDAGRFDAGARSDGGSVADGGARTDGGASGSDAGTVAGDGGAGECGTGPIDFSGIPMSCRRPECYDNDTCAQLELSFQGYDGYTRCGSSLTFDPSSSTMACMEDPPFGWGPMPLEKRCGLTSFSGTVDFYCAPDMSEVVARWHGRMDWPTGGMGIYYYLGHDYWSGSGGGSGDSFNLTWPAETPGDYFVGFQSVALPTMGTPQAHLQVWFFSGDLMSAMYYAGGFSADVPPM